MKGMVIVHFVQGTVEKNFVRNWDSYIKRGVTVSFTTPFGVRVI